MNNDENTSPSAPVMTEDRRKKWLHFAAGFLGWYLVNGLLWLMVLNTDFEELINGCLFPINILLTIILSIRQASRSLGLGILAALGVNLLISLFRGMFGNAYCFIPFFIETMLSR